MEKGIAITTIIMVLLGMVVISFVSFWLVKTLSGGGVIDEQGCRTLYLNWCKKCERLKWSSGTGFIANTPEELCYRQYNKTWGLQSISTGNCQNMRTNCNRFGIV